MSTYPVYRSKYGHLYSEGVTRYFGENKLVETADDVTLCPVMPLKVDPEESGMSKYGKIRVVPPEGE